MPQGHTGILRYETAWVDGDDIPATPTWVEIAKAVDVTINMDSADGAADSREVDFMADVGGIQNAEITFTFLLTAVDHATYTKLIGAKTAPIWLQCMQGTTAGDSGWQMPVVVTGHSESQPNQGAQTASFTVKFFPAVTTAGAMHTPARVVYA